jgi:mRNA interferase RelE/StbE
MWQVKIHRLVLEEDFKQIDKAAQKAVLKAIYKKLSLDPDHYGAPLKGDLKQYRKLKIMDYRVIYLVQKQEVKVLVLKVGLRRDDEVYREMLLRMKKI